MVGHKTSDAGGNWLARHAYRSLAVLLCVALSVAMIVNNQLGGEAMWFWYATVFHDGAKLYSQLHIALQPLYLLLLDGWIQVAGKKIIAVECLSLLPILAMCAGLWMILRESAWTDWMKGAVLLGAFALTVSGHSYRFDDYHVFAETLIVLAMLVLLLLPKAATMRSQLLLGGALGLICGLTITTRLTDGAALLAASLICVPFLVGRQKVSTTVLLLVVAAVTILSIVHLTGDTFHAYLFNSMIHAAGSKGGTGSIFAAPFQVVWNTIVLVGGTRHTLVRLLIILAVGPLVARYWRPATKYIPLLMIAVALLLVAVGPDAIRKELLRGSLISISVMLLTLSMYVLPVIVLVRLIRAKKANLPWDPREVVVLLPLAEWASYSAGAAAEPLTNYYAPVALLLLLVPVLRPFRRYAGWGDGYFSGFLLVLALSSISGKIIVPYSWQNYVYGPMFVDRQWYRHPVYGEMYIDSDLLKFSEGVCRDIHADPGKTEPELLSLPYPFPNYFCATPPWHNYVQTFFDTSTRTTIEHLMGELQTDPPQYIVYQRQLNIMTGAEKLYNHGHRLAQRDMDDMIFQKLASGQWKVLETNHYLEPEEDHHEGDAAWYVIQTRP